MQITQANEKLSEPGRDIPNIMNRSQIIKLSTSLNRLKR